MDPNWWVERFGTIGLMLSAMLYDRHRLLKDAAEKDKRIEALTDRLIEQSQSNLSAAIAREVQTLTQLTHISEAIQKGAVR
ncbi:hypothetical protein P775_08470 [Puniceibacterium antarcticum]|uniref:Uncharacterized protein n=1 Tax=Puniceibacterium antarcticum TaxID=1206336 RepID=A0A2G8RG46_9RHOB|nr:hypothetical protein [Puniceibacterium antarcticum]PIL20554.1 hypothetical protein P775_08470 [Puniceibacterium antarcticum]